MATFDTQDSRGLVGKHLIYPYDNGWNYEIYVKMPNIWITILALERQSENIILDSFITLFFSYGNF